MTLEHVLVAVLVLAAGIYAAILIRRELSGRPECCNECPRRPAKRDR